VIGTVASHETPFSGYQLRLFVGDSNASRNLLIDSRGGEQSGRVVGMSPCRYISQ
jgi:hypothetical protein